MTKAELKQRLLTLVETQQRLHNKYFSPQAKSELREFIFSGVDRMTIAECNNPSSIRLAEANLEIIISSCRIRSQQQREINISRETFVTVRMMDCPKWPYC